MPWISVRTGRSSRVSMSLTGWVIFWLLASPFVLLWLALKLAVVIVKAIAAAIDHIDGQPAIPPGLRAPPRRTRP